MSSDLKDLADPGNPRSGPKDQSRRRWLLRIVGVSLLLYGALAYFFVPLIWRKAIKRHPDLSGGPRITHTANGIPGDPINLALLGSEEEIIRAMLAAKWYPADPLTFRSSVRIAVDSVFRRPDEQAPVSDLFLFGRKQDLAFEEPVGNNPRQRHHVRFWRWEEERWGEPVWFGAATFDTRVGFSHTTAQITHHIGAEVDAERDRIMKALEAAGRSQESEYLNDFQQPPEGRNGGGDPWRSDGRLGIVVIQTASGLFESPRGSPSDQ